VGWFFYFELELAGKNCWTLQEPSRCISRGSTLPSRTQRWRLEWGSAAWRTGEPAIGSFSACGEGLEGISSQLFVMPADWANTDQQLLASGAEAHSFMTAPAGQNRPQPHAGNQHGGDYSSLTIDPHVDDGDVWLKLKRIYIPRPPRYI